MIDGPECLRLKSLNTIIFFRHPGDPGYTLNTTLVPTWIKKITSVCIHHYLDDQAYILDNKAFPRYQNSLDIVGDFSKFRQLESLTLEDYGIRSSEVQKLRIPISVNRLDLSLNCLAEKIDLSYLTNLKYLKLENCDLRWIPKLPNSIETLVIPFNDNLDLKSIPKLTNLTELDLGNRVLNEDDFDSLPMEAIRKLSFMRIYDICYEDLPIGETDPALLNYVLYHWEDAKEYHKKLIANLEKRFPHCVFRFHDENLRWYNNTRRVTFFQP